MQIISGFLRRELINDFIYNSGSMIHV